MKSEASPQRSNRTLVLLTIAWITLTGIGAFALLRHEFDGVSVVDAPAQWPEALGAFNPSGRDLTVVMAIHPDCPCTRASIEQLDRLLTRYPDAVQAIGLISDRVDGEAETLRQTDYWRRLDRMAGARPVRDVAGHWAKLLGAPVSGTVAVYDAGGALRFQGGLTASRGHDGPSRALSMLSAWAEGASFPESVSLPAFGCALETP